jgi:hypothetical protein
MFSSHDWRWRISATDNDHGLPLQRQFRMSRASQIRDGGNMFAQINLNTAGYDDRILRGHGVVHTPPSWNAFTERYRPRKGRWEWYANVNAYRGSIGEDRKIGWSFNLNPTFYVTDSFSIYSNFYMESTPQWMVWDHDDLFGTFKERAVQFDAGVNWKIGEKQEFRVKMQALGLTAPLRQAWRVTDEGTPVPVTDPVSDFSLSTLGFQIRYRRELAPLSDLYVVYGRGGFLFHEFQDDQFSLLSDAFDLRDTDQILVKISYRFERD